MKLAPASATGVVNLTLADSTNRTLAWNKNEDKLTVKHYNWHKSISPITANSICQLSVITIKIESRYRDTGGIERIVPEEHFFFRKTIGELYTDKCLVK